jgi:hypothetical protein
MIVCQRRSRLSNADEQRSVAFAFCIAAMTLTLSNRGLAGQTPLCEHDAKAQTRLAAELLRFDEVLDQNASIRFDDAL